MIHTTTASSASETRITAIFSLNHENIGSLPNYLILTFAVSLLASVYGLKSINAINAMNAAAKITPITLPLPVKSNPS